jgi:hypothetical protein
MTRSRIVLSVLGLVLASAGFAPAARLHGGALHAAGRQAIDGLTRLRDSASAQPPASGAVAAFAPDRAFLDRYCVTCHNERRRTAGLTLEKADVSNVGAGAEVWEKVVRKLRTRAMPPAGAARPDGATSDVFVAHLITSLDRDAAANPNPGRPLVHRLNRAEYANAVRDLLALEVDGRALLPADDSGYGFDNNADVLTVSPGLFERYMSAARKISRLAVGDTTIRPLTDTYKVPVVLLQDDRMSDQMPFGSRGGLAVQHRFPLDGEYVLKIALQRTWQGSIRGLAESHELDVFLDRVPVKRFTVGGECAASLEPRCKAIQGEVSEYEQTADLGLEVRFPAKAGTRLLSVAFRKDASAPEGVLEPPLPVTSFEYAGLKETDPAIDHIEVRGPYTAEGPGDTSSRRRIFVCTPSGAFDEEACATKILSTLASRAYRRPVTTDEVHALVGFYKASRVEGAFEAGIEAALRRILVSVNFLFRIERDPPGIAPATAYRLSDLELASRLSFFLWSSIPDDELLDVAARGQLGDPQVLERQVRRLLADDRATALVSNFAGQWLFLRNVRNVTPDPEAFPDFDDNLREALQRETELFVDSVIRGDRNVVDFLTADYTFVNERLAKHYGIPDVYGSHFRRVTLGEGHRRGLLGQGSILTVTSYATRTSPVLRGKWLLENVLGAPPPPPPPNVPALKENEEGEKPLSVRERMEQHRKNPTCASCHARMDPLGFALENFDAIGRWRTTSEASTPIDASGALPDGATFQGPEDLRQLLVTRREEFVAALTEKLLTYAVGRGVEYYDAPAIRAIVRDAARHDYRWSSLVLGIVKSSSFQMRRSRAQ